MLFGSLAAHAFEVYPSLATATNGANKIAASQIALTSATTDAVFATTGYSQSVSNLSKISPATDNVFSDGTPYQTPTVSDDVSTGFFVAPAGPKRLLDARRIANQVVIPVGADGSIRLSTQTGSHLIADHTGWYTDSTAASGTAGLFIPVSPYRVLDTRSGGRPAAGSTTTLLAATTGTAAAGRSGLTMNVTATAAGAAGDVTVWPSSTRPTASSLNLTAAGQTIANHAVSAVGSDGGVRLFTQNANHFVVDVNGWYV